MYIRNSDLNVKPEHREAYLKALTEHARSAKRGVAIRFDVMQTLADPNRIMTIEAYADKTAWQRQDSVSDLATVTRGWVTPGKNPLSEALNVEPTDQEWDTADEGALPRWATYGPLYIHNSWTYAFPGKGALLLQLLVEEVRLAKQMERGMMRFDIYQNLENPGLLHAYEVYADKEAHLFHYEQTYLKEFYKVGVPLYDRTRGDPVIECRPLEPSESEWRWPSRI